MAKAATKAKAKAKAEAAAKAKATMKRKPAAHPPKPTDVFASRSRNRRRQRMLSRALLGWSRDDLIEKLDLTVAHGFRQDAIVGWEDVEIEMKPLKDGTKQFRKAKKRIMERFDLAPGDDLPEELLNDEEVNILMLIKRGHLVVNNPPELMQARISNAPLSPKAAEEAERAREEAEALADEEAEAADLAADAAASGADAAAEREAEEADAEAEREAAAADKAADAEADATTTDEGVPNEDTLTPNEE